VRFNLTLIPEISFIGRHSATFEKKPKILSNVNFAASPFPAFPAFPAFAAFAAFAALPRLPAFAALPALLGNIFNVSAVVLHGGRS
jgi:hypothetical protein